MFKNPFVVDAYSELIFRVPEDNMKPLDLAVQTEMKFWSDAKGFMDKIHFHWMMAALYIVARDKGRFKEAGRYRFEMRVTNRFITSTRTQRLSD